ncbi:Phage portal protein, lambda family [Pelagimonas phthalicica]|uniref:Phage portal protein, lambda family n=1 Tax=Pelagimonas phthalicica TaxID=1037362 RepID=A0A238JA64_9RHOB|nr:phage portal protein [Pelagimonas phthalicica]TDS94190.1 lambda family phage portal protein [Pelagimonas phthalicica]SMX27285.1 Phage portal protein, lambda family [Pelagimonas phthalicica]
MFGLGKRNQSEPAQRVEPVVEVEERESPIPKIRRRGNRQSGVVGQRSFDAAISDRLTANWSTTPLSADQVIDRNQRVLVARSREEALKNDYMKSYLRLCEQNMVGHRGFSLQAQTRLSDGSLDRPANEALEAWWKKWQRAENCDITGRRSFRRMCKSAVRTAAKDGEFMFREIKGAKAGPMGYALQTLDPQRCPVDYNIDRMPNGRFVRQGIEYSREGRPLAFYFMTGDPAHSGYTFNGSSLKRVPAAEIIHGFLDEIEGQRRGIPWAATSLWRLHMLGGFEKAALTSARAGAAVGGFIEWKDGEGPEADEELEDEELYIEPEGGVFQELPAGAQVKEFNSHYPAGEFGPFHKAMLRGAGAGMGVAYVSFANDLEGVNFSSIRQGVLDERDHWMDLQEWLIETLIDRCYQSALAPALLMGLIAHGGIRLRPERIERYRNVYWQGRRWAWVDPSKDIRAEIDAKNNLLTSPSEIIRRKGDDPDTTWRTYAADIKAMQAAGMPEAFIMAAVLGVQPSAPAQPKPEKDQSEESDNDKDDPEEE